MTAEDAGNWMDQIKSDHRYAYMNIWHYVNVEKGSVYDPNVKEENAINQLTRVINELEHREKMSDEDIKKDILIAMHLTGDIHQPLHCGYAEDKGGNTVQVKYKGKPTNLHRVWDSEIIEGENINVNDCLQQRKNFDKEEMKMLAVINPEKWMNQPRSQVAGVYAFTDNTIDDAYIQKNKKLIEQDIFIAGVRLAAILNAAFKG
jgi:hypothetical protein